MAKDPGAANALLVHHDAYTDLGHIAEWAAARGFEMTAVAYADETIDPVDFSLVTVLGSDASAYDDSLSWLPGELAFVERALQRRVPTLGICFGAQVLARCLGSDVTAAHQPEVGWTYIESRFPDLLQPGPWFEMHGDTFDCPSQAVELAWNAAGTQAFVHDRAIATQFHPEVTPDLLGTWLEAAPDLVERAGADPEQVRREAMALSADAARRAHRLFDHLWHEIDP